MAYWTTEEVAEHLGITAQDVYETRRRGAFPGRLGVRRGKRLMFPADQITSPSEPETTTDPGEALIWAINGMHATLRLILRELRAQRPQWFAGELDTTTGEEE